MKSFIPAVLLLISMPCGAIFDPAPEPETSDRFLWDEPETVVDLTFTGDIMAHDVNFNMKNYNDIYEGLQDTLKHDDLSFANLEFPMDDTKPNANYPQFNVTPKYAEAAIKAGFEVFTMANNHSNDQGAKSILQTIKNMKKFEQTYGITWSGLKENPKDPLELKVITVKGVKIGFVGLTNILNAWTAKDYVYAPIFWDMWTDKPVGTAADDLIALIKKWDSQVDCLILGIHDGVEYVKTPREYQKDLYRKFVEAGVDILWGNHPHVVLPWEQVWQGKNQKVIFYSLGNFISGQATRINPASQEGIPPRTGDGVLMQVKIKKIREGVTITNVVPLWTNNFRDPIKGMVVKFTKDLSVTGSKVWQNYYALRLKTQSLLGTPWVLGTPPIDDAKSTRLVRFP